MQNCTFCGSELPEDARFCGRCGHVMNVINTAYEGATSRSDAPFLYPPGTMPGAPPPPYPPAGTMPGTPPTWYPAASTVPNTSPPPQRQDDERNIVPPWSPFYGAAAVLGSGQSYAPGAPMVQGTPQIGGVPGVSGTPGSFAQPGTAPAYASSQAPSYPGAHTANPYGGQQPSSLQNYQPPQTAPQSPTQAQHLHAQHAAPHLHHVGAVATKVAAGSALKTIIIVTSIVVVLAGGAAGAAAYLLTRPQPVISLTSIYKAGNTFAGTSGTTLNIRGEKFSSNSVITFLLDGATAPGSQKATSDSKGNFRVDLKITDAWMVGTHTLTARDASNYSTQNSVTVMVVSQGQANTPGPLGAPPDDATFKVNASVQGQFTAGFPFTAQETEIVTGHPDPAGGSVCQSSPEVTTGVTTNGLVPYQDTRTYSCTGSYKAGKITLTVMIMSDVYVFSSPGSGSCALKSPQTNEQLTGSYTGQNTFTGSVTYPTIADSMYSCTGIGTYTYYNFHQGKHGTWTGQVTK
jgi:hypothetical protein